MISRSEHLFGFEGSRRDAVASLRRFLGRSHRACSVEVWGAAKIGKTKAVTKAIEEAVKSSGRRIHVLPDDFPEPLSLERIYDLIRFRSGQTRLGPRDSSTTRFVKTPEDMFAEINRILDETAKPGEMVLFRILISEVDGTAKELEYVLGTSSGWRSDRKIVLEMRRRLPSVRFFRNESLHGETLRIVGLRGDEAETMVYHRLENHLDKDRAVLVAHAVRRWCGRHPGLLDVFITRILQGNFSQRLLAARLEDIHPLFFNELVDGESLLSEALRAIRDNLSTEARRQLAEPPQSGVLHIDLVESGLTTDDEGRHLALLARRFGQTLRIFISYASEDRKQVAGLASKLAAVEGLMPIWDHHPGVLPPGEEWEGRILSLVRSCPAFLFVCTPTSLAKLKTSPMMKKELSAVLERQGDCLVIPVGEPSGVPEELLHLQWVDPTLQGGDDLLVDRLEQRRRELWQTAAQG